MEKKVSIVVPVYNGEDTIGACIDSILNQDYPNRQLIVVDDGSTDGSLDVCRRKLDGRADALLIHQANGGRSVARRVGTELAEGDWVAYVDADDKLLPGALSRLMARTSDKTDIVFGNGKSIGMNVDGTMPMKRFRHLTVRAEGTIGVPWGSLYRRDLLLPRLFEVPRELVNGEDYIFWLRLVFSTEKDVSVLADNVYDKGEAHTSNSFRWTADYCEKLNRLRMESIPTDERDTYFDDILNDRIANLFATSLWQSKAEWAGSKFMTEIRKDLKLHGRSLSLKQRLFLALPSITLRRLVASCLERLRG